MEVTFKLTVDEANSLLSVLGQLPSSSNVWPLMRKISEQAQQSLSEQQTEAEVVAE